MLLYLVTYDIPCNKRRKKVSDLLEGYGARVQYSVFECVLEPKKFDELLERLQKRINLEQDNVRCYPISSHTLGQVVILGSVPLYEPPSSYIV